MILLTIATAIQFVLLLALALVVLSLARQVGILHERLSPAGMTRSREGIEPGQVLPAMDLEALSGAAVDFGSGEQAEGKPAALLFVAADCPICKSVMPAFESTMAGDGVDYASYWIADGLPGPGGTMPDYHAFAADHHIDPDRFVVSQELGLSLGVRQIPVLVLLDAQHRLLVRETLSGPRQVERLLADPARRSG